MSDENQPIILDEFGQPYNFGLRMHTAEELSAATAQMGGELTCAAPANIPVDNPLDWMILQSQSIYPFCHAHMRTVAEEFLYFLVSGGKYVQLSRRFASITDMRQDGNDSSPAGASIPGSVLASRDFGNIPESLMPYFAVPGPGQIRSSADMDRWCRSHYSNAISEDLLKQAKKIHIKNFVKVKNYDQMDAGLITGNYAVMFGIRWHQGYSNLRGVEFVAKVPNGGTLGGHALCVAGWKTRGGERWHKMNNSHDGFGAKKPDSNATTMAVYLSPQQWEYEIRNSQYGFYLVSDMEIPDMPRGWDFLDQANHAMGGKPIQWV